MKNEKDFYDCGDFFNFFYYRLCAVVPPIELEFVFELSDNLQLTYLSDTEM